MAIMQPAANGTWAGPIRSTGGALTGEHGAGLVPPDVADAVGQAEDTSKVAAALLALSKQLELPEGFLMNLLLQDGDWAFIVKAQAILETAVTSLLVADLGKAELEDVIAEDLNMSQRLKMLSALNLCSPVQRDMMWRLAKLRNRLAHSAKGTLFSLAEYLRDKTTREQFWRVFGINWAATPEAKIATIENKLPEFLPLAPRLAIWSDLVGVVIEAATTTIERRRLEDIQTTFNQKVLLGR